MYLYIKTDHAKLYAHHSPAYEGDSGIDLFFPYDVSLLPGETKLVDLEICCQMKKSTLSMDFKYYSYYLYPRSSIYKTPLRLANSVGIIDAGYRNSIKVAIDNTGDKEYVIKSNTKLFQICAPNLEPIKVILTDFLQPTERGSGFGSSGL